VHSDRFLVGVIEGFYGRSWTHEARLAYADYLSEAGLNAYIYCPKGDPYLRRLWEKDWPTEQWESLLSLSAAYRKRSIYWGVGLSPVELYRDYGAQKRNRLKRKVERLAELAAPIIAILFDDMPGDLDSLACRQAEIVGDVSHWLPNVQVIVCPTYYSFDPILERYFGAMPTKYWQQLGRELPETIQVFWTGNNVCSSSITVADIQAIVEPLGRPVTLWDNYPVNDGAVRSNFLYMSKLADRSDKLRPYISGHFCNPMNQAFLSLPALGGLAELYGGPGFSHEALSRILGARTWERLLLDWHDFERRGWLELGEQRRLQLVDVYDRLPGAAAGEVAEWLRGEYKFDPACLTA
jgi:hyaluronoglucosaminidase